MNRYREVVLGERLGSEVVDDEQVGEPTTEATATPTSVPGFGPLVAVAGLLAALVWLRRE